MKGLRRATRADAREIQIVLASDRESWQLLEGAPLRPDEATHLLAEVPPGVPLGRKYLWLGEDVVIDVVKGYPDARTWYLGLIFIAPSARGAGLGTRLIEELCSYISERRGSWLRLAVVAENHAARRLYDRLGFQFVATRRRGTQQVDVLERMVVRPHPEAAPGDFYVAPNCCTRCGVPPVHAPALFRDGEAACYVAKQPNTDELPDMLEVMHYQEFDCVRYRGNDPEVLVQITKRGLRSLVD
ncbi:MAG: GNAT family N-acetyltransferase [Deltaproteobacteria bacterium]|nr:GNAT family N-acetyltransferase [Deltaproteobacteria bacterium]